MRGFKMPDKKSRNKKEKSEIELLKEINEKLDKLVLVTSMKNATKSERKIIAKNSKFSKREIERLTGIDRHEF